MPTYVPRPTDIRNDWYLLDCEDQVLGRLATRAAVLLMGKHKPDYTPFLKTGDHVIVVNAQKIKVPGYPGGIKETNVREVRAKHPERIVESAILGMLPKNKVGKQLARRLKVYAGAQHPHEAQQPKEMDLNK